MPQGLAKIQQIASEAKARQAAYDEAGPGVRFFTIKDGESARVRFLEQGNDVWYVWTHELPKKTGQRYGDSVMCLDQDDKGEPCPACARNIGRTARVAINVIWYGAPKFRREAGKDGKPGKIAKDQAGNPIVDGAEDCVAVWNASQTVGGRLAYLDAEHGGLTGCVCKVVRQGVEKKTEYMIDVTSKEEPSAADQALYKTKGDPRKAIRQLSWRDMEQAYSGGGQATTPSGAPAPEAGQGQPGSGNAFVEAASGAIKRGAFGG